MVGYIRKITPSSVLNQTGMFKLLSSGSVFNEIKEDKGIKIGKHADVIFRIENDISEGIIVDEPNFNLIFDMYKQQEKESIKILNNIAIISDHPEKDEIESIVQNDRSIQKMLINPIVEGKADFVVGSRFLGLDKKGDRSTLCRRIGIAYFALLLSFITGRRITDPTSGFRAAGRKAILALAKRYPVDYPEVESLLYLARCGLGIVEVPVSMRKRFEGRSSISTLSSIFYILKVSIGIGLLLLERNQNI